MSLIIRFCFSAQLKTKEDQEGKHALLKADGKYELDTLAKEKGKEVKDKEFQARNDRFDFHLNPAEQDKEKGHGTFSFADKVDFGFFKKFMKILGERQRWDV